MSRQEEQLLTDSMLFLSCGQLNLTPYTHEEFSNHNTARIRELSMCSAIISIIFGAEIDDQANRDQEGLLEKTEGKVRDKQWTQTHLSRNLKNFWQ